MEAEARRLLRALRASGRDVPVPEEDERPELERLARALGRVFLEEVVVNRAMRGAVASGLRGEDALVAVIRAMADALDMARVSLYEEAAREAIDRATEEAAREAIDRATGHRGQGLVEGLSRPATPPDWRSVAGIDPV